MSIKLGQRLLRIVKIKNFRPITMFIPSIFIVLFTLFSFTLHKEYHSLTNIKYNKNEKTLQITMRLFTNDIDFALQKYFEKSLEFGTKNEIKEADKLLNLYLNQKFKITINDKKANYHVLGKEFEKDLVYVYMEIKEVENIKKIGVQNTVLTEVFSEQENIVKLIINDIRKSFIFTNEYNKGMLNL